MGSLRVGAVAKLTDCTPQVEGALKADPNEKLGEAQAEGNKGKDSNQSFHNNLTSSSYKHLHSLSQFLFREGLRLRCLHPQLIKFTKQRK